MSLSKISAFAIFVVMFALSETGADASIPSAVLAQKASPVAIDQCVSDIVDSTVGNTRYYFEVAAAFTNRGAQPITAVRLRFDTFNAFHEHLRSYYGTSTNALAPLQSENDIRQSAKIESLATQGAALGMAPPQALLDIMRDPTWSFTNLDDTTAASVCSVDTVMLANGTEWKAPAPTGKLLAATVKEAQKASPQIELEPPSSN